MTYMRVFKKENPVSGLAAVLVRDTVRLQVEAIRVSIVVPVRVVGGVLKGPDASLPTCCQTWV